jgi:hypothetical protein
VIFLLLLDGGLGYSDKRSHSHNRYSPSYNDAFNKALDKKDRKIFDNMFSIAQLYIT